jgi:hypothetical protein
MSSNLASGLAMLFAISVLDDERRREHARSVVATLGLDQRLEPVVPLPPKGGRRSAAYERVLEGLRTVSEEPEPQRTLDIEFLLTRFG